MKVAGPGKEKKDIIATVLLRLAGGSQPSPDDFFVR